MTTLFVTPSGPGFRDLASALASANNGDVVQVEPFPGGATASIGSGIINGTTLKQVSIEGDPASGLTELPTIMAPAGTPAIEVKGGASGVVLWHLNISAGVRLDAGSSATTIANSHIDRVTEVGGISGNGNNVFFGNTITGYLDLTGNAPSEVTGDQVLYNQFTPSGIITGVPALLQLTTDTGALVQGNFFLHGSPQSIVVAGGGTAANNIVIYNNDFTAGSFVGAAELNVTDVLSNSVPPVPTFVAVTNNNFNSGNYLALSTYARNGADLNVVIQGNDFRTDNIGIQVVAENGDAGNIDAGGGPLGSLGGNNFKGYSGPPSTTRGAIVSDDTYNTVFAQYSIFSVSDPNTVIFGNVDVANPLDANHAFVDTVYEDFLKRPGDPTAGGELDVWVSQFDSVGQAGIVQSLLSSHEANLRLVDDYYIRFLGRLANNSVQPMDGGEEADWVTMLDQGATAEEVISGILSSSEFFARSRSLARNVVQPDLDSPNVNYIQALYQVLLGRQAGVSERDYWVGMLDSEGQAGTVLGLLYADEFRVDAVNLMYGHPENNNVVLNNLEPNLLHRQNPPTDAEINGWVSNRSLSLLDIEVNIAGDSEFFDNG